MRRILEQKWITYLELYGEHWTERQQENARTLFYAGATSFWQGLMVDVPDPLNHEDDAELATLITNMDQLHTELEEFAASHRPKN